MNSIYPVSQLAFCPLIKMGQVKSTLEKKDAGQSLTSINPTANVRNKPTPRSTTTQSDHVKQSPQTSKPTNEDTRSADNPSVDKVLTINSDHSALNDLGINLQKKAVDISIANDADIPNTERKHIKLQKFASLCSHIVDHVYVSGTDVASNMKILEEHRISCIVNCTKEQEDNYFEGRVIGNEPSRYLSLSLRDGASEDLFPFIPQVLEFIHNSMNEGKRVLVHCHQGVSRSCTFAIAWLMWRHRMRFKEAFAFAKEKRGVCSPNSAFLCQLIEFDHLLFSDDNHCDREIYRVAPHAQYDQSIVLKRCFQPGSRSFIDLSTFLLLDTSVYVVKTLKKTFIFRTSNCSEEDVRVAEREIKYLKWLNTSANEAEEDEQFPIQFETQGQESEEFRSLFTLGINFVTHETSNYFYEEEIKWREQPDKSACVSIEATAEIQENNIGNSTETAKAQLYAYGGEESWDVIDEYDSEDLVPDLAFFLLQSSCKHHYLWIGEDFSSTTDVESIAKLARKRFSLAEDCDEVQILKQGEEHETFWNAFESGY